MKLNALSPVLQVRDLSEAITFYLEVLGFEQEFVYGEPAYYAGVKRDGNVLHLHCNAQDPERIGKGSVYFFCDSVDAYFEAVRDRGAEITTELDSWPYGMRDFQVRDPDGNLLTFGAPVSEE